MRLDAVLAALSNKSRSQVKEALEAGEVRLNWHEEEKGESPLESWRHLEPAPLWPGQALGSSSLAKRPPAGGRPVLASKKAINI